MDTIHWTLIADGSNQLNELAKQFGVSWPHLISQTISFCIVCFFLQRFAYRPILELLAKRREEIAAGQAMAEQNREQLERSQRERQQILDAANQQAEQMLNEALAAAADVREKKVQAAVEEVNQIRAKAQQQIQRERQQMLRELEGHVGQLVVKTTAVVSGRVLTDDDQNRLLTDAATTLEAH